MIKRQNIPHWTLLTLLWAGSALALAEPTTQELWIQSIKAELSGNLAQALEIHERILPLAKKSYAAYLREGWLLYQSGKYQRALSFYEKASGAASGAISPLYGAMNCHLALKNNNKAERLAKAILVIDELNYTANLQLAAGYYQEKKFSLAASYYRKLNRLYPEDLAVASGLAWAYLEQGKARQAAPIFKMILMLSADYPHAARGLEICNQINPR